MKTVRRYLPIILLAAGAGMTGLGIFLGEHIIVLRKAIKICMECIGIG